MKRAAIPCVGLLAVILVLAAPQEKTTIEVSKKGSITLAVVDMRGAGQAQQFMGPFNSTLYEDLKGSGLFSIVPKGLLPLNNPQQPSDFRGVSNPDPNPAGGGGYYLSDWSAKAKYLVFGYTGVQGPSLALYGWLYDVSQPMQGAQMIAKRYFGDVSEAGARKIAHEFAADIISQFGGTSLAGTHIYFVSDRTGTKEIWAMDWDGANQRQITRLHSTSIGPAVSPDGTKVAFTTYAKINPGIVVYSIETGRALPFYNQVASLNATPNFTPDGKHIIYASTASANQAGGEKDAQLYIANLDGTDFKRVLYRRGAICVEPKVNPKTSNEVLFVSGPGPQQIYRMDLNGSGVEMVSPGGGEASNPAWHPDGQHMAFSWTRGFATGKFNVFIMDISSRQYNQLTHDEGRNENPTWAPDGLHLVFQSDRRGHNNSQIYSMLADGTEVKQLTTQGKNYSPVWGK